VIRVEEPGGEEQEVGPVEQRPAAEKLPELIVEPTGDLILTGAEEESKKQAPSAGTVGDAISAARSALCAGGGVGPGCSPARGRCQLTLGCVSGCLTWARDGQGSLVLSLSIPDGGARGKDEEADR